ncbi:hypothetical protein ACN42_g9478 [Penicillium freii]|uniref:Uncharacterized protein n=1 Tax=Penicillium freii TaxID=48697 RepID=A0A124GQC7_PENFR|nr:hypothetical protein ACN42_g9478 [Penicillium freii]
MEGSLCSFLGLWFPFLCSLSPLSIPSPVPISSLLTTTSSSPKVPLCLPSSRKNLLGILFVACKLTWFPTSLSVPTFTQRLHYFCFSLFFSVSISGFVSVSLLISPS